MIAKPKPSKKRHKHKASILQEDKKCFQTGRTDSLEEHHIFFGRGQREISEANGFKVWLTYDWHQDHKIGVHHNIEFDRYLKRKCQAKFEETHSRDEFMALIGENYIW